MRTILATLAVATTIVTAGVPAAEAAPAAVNVRIEGETETLFEGPVLTDGHNVRASSDTKAPEGGRRCNGLNNSQNPLPGPTPTAASVDAMSILDLDFDGQWYAEPFEDYFIKRWGPDAQDDAEAEYWGVVVNNVFTNVGGCQYQLDGGDEVLWVYDAFDGRPRLALYPADYSAGAAPLTASVELGQPFEVEVEDWGDYNEGAPPASPQRTGAESYEGAEVAPVVTGSGGFEAIDSDDPATEVTDEDGLAAIEFAEVGWHRIKATDIALGGEETAVRSNRLDVCVYEVAPSECPPLPADDQVRTPPAPEEPEDPGEPQDPGEPEEPDEPGDDPPTGDGGKGGSAAQPSPAAAIVAALDPSDPVRLQPARLDRSRISQGLVKVSWRELDAGPGIARWTVSSQTLGREGARYLKRASGRSGTEATLRLPAGASYRLRLTVTDVLGRTTTTALGRVQVPD
ncbi:MAG TPA: DUF4430 domain-containing protein [Solirubrobacterales bacterium]|nr:DUF4430 domain-containing protein [Solirubrobacterales bacterium]